MKVVDRIDIVDGIVANVWLFSELLVAHKLMPLTFWSSMCFRQLVGVLGVGCVLLWTHLEPISGVFWQ